jgi:2-polyprenyl-3-methyl-5-hydroxy-6-metoxy-1,4-benzoquinol methylase
MCLTKLSVKDIRPPQFSAGQKVAALTDVGRMLSRCGEFVGVACPACGRDDSPLKYTKNGFQYVSCRGCDTFYMSPRPTPEVLEWFYRDSPNYAYWNKHIFPASEAARRERIFVPRVDRLLEICARYGVTADAVLEVGAGFGTFCSELKSRGVRRVVAVEPTPDLAATCRDRGLEVIETPVEQLDAMSVGQFDVVASFEVIEHLFAPAEFVANMLRLLKRDGLMLLTCPNGQGFDIATLGTSSTSVDHEHLNYFNPASLALLLASSGMEVLESLTPGRLDAELVRNKVLEGEFSLDRQPFLRKVLIEEWERHGQAFQDFLVAQGLSSNLWIVARRAVA